MTNHVNLLQLLWYWDASPKTFLEYSHDNHHSPAILLKIRTDHIISLLFWDWFQIKNLKFSKAILKNNSSCTLSLSQNNKNSSKLHFRLWALQDPSYEHEVVGLRRGINFFFCYVIIWVHWHTLKEIHA